MALNEVSGVFKNTNKGGGILLDPSVSFQIAGDEPTVPASLVRQYALVDGVALTGEARSGKQGYLLEKIASIAGGLPTNFKTRPAFARLVAVDPYERFNLGINGDPSM